MGNTENIAQRYLPVFLVIALQALLIMTMPTFGNDGQAGLASGSGGFSGSGADFASGPVGGAVGSTQQPLGGGAPASAATQPGGGQAISVPSGLTGSTGSSSASPAPAPGEPAPGDVSGASAPKSEPQNLSTGRDPQEPGLWPWSNPWDLAGDRGKCAEGGKLQQDILHYSPPCVPTFTGDNGGATAKGVTPNAIRVVQVLNPDQPQNAAVQATKLGSTNAQRREDYATWGAFFNKRYEFYGRKVDWILHQGDCTATDPVCWRNTAKQVDQDHDPFLTWVADGNPPPAFFDEASKRGIVNNGGWHLTSSFNSTRRPFHWDHWMDGTQSAVNVGDYWCKKLVGKKALRAGDAVLQTQDRKLGILVPQNPDTFPDGQALAATVSGGQCGSAATKPILIGFDDSDITRLQEQMTSVVTTMKNEGVTTVTCLCTLVVPVFMTQAADQQNYYPEHLMAGTGGTDYDFVGRLYSPTQWRNAFGPSHLAAFGSEQDQDHYRANADMGAGEPCSACLNPFWYQHLAAIQIQYQGPNLNAFTMEKGLHTGPRLGGFTTPREWPGWKCCDPLVQAWEFGPNDYGANQDTKEVYWDPAAISPLDGEPGSFVCSNGCRRFELGGWPAGDPLQEYPG